MTQDCAFDVRHLGLGRGPVSPLRDRAFAMPIAGLGRTLVRPDEGTAVYHTPEHFHGVSGMPAGVGQPKGGGDTKPVIHVDMPGVSSPDRGNIGPGASWEGNIGHASSGSGHSAELMPGNEELFPHGHYTPKSPNYSGVVGLPEGVGRAPTGFGLTTITLPYSCPAGTGWKGLSSTGALFLQVSAIIASAMPPGSGVAPEPDGWVYFTIPGVGSGRFRYSPSFGAIQTCVAQSVAAPSPPVNPPATSGAAVVGVSFSAAGAPTVQYSANPLGPSFFALPLPPNAPPPGVVTFVTAPGLGQFSWVLVTPSPGQRPSAPPPGVSLPGAWALVRPHFWMWYPAPPRTLAVVNTYFVYTNSDQLFGIPNPGLPRPTAPPPQLAGTTAGIGQWINSGPGYWAWAPSMSTALAPVTSYAWLWALLLVGGAGIGAYYLLD